MDLGFTLIVTGLLKVLGGVGIGVMSLFLPGGLTTSLMLSALFGFEQVLGAMAVQMMFGLAKMWQDPGTSGEVLMDTLMTPARLRLSNESFEGWSIFGVIRLMAYSLGIILMQFFPILNGSLLLSLGILGIVILKSKDKTTLVIALSLIALISIGLGGVGRMMASLPIIMITLSSANVKAMENQSRKVVIDGKSNNTFDPMSLLLGAFLPLAGINSAVMSSLSNKPESIVRDEVEVIDISELFSNLLLSAFSEGVAIGLLFGRNTGKSMATDLIGSIAISNSYLAFILISSIFIVLFLSWLWGDLLVELMFEALGSINSNEVLKYINLGLVFGWALLNGYVGGMRIAVASFVAFTSHNEWLLDLLAKVPARSRVLIPLAAIVASSLIK